ncbi:MAG: NUDIX hydrolase [Bacteroidota bacterium]
MPINPWITHTEKKVYENPWIAVEHREVTNPGGGAGIYGLVKFKNWAIGIIPVDEEGNTYLVGQWRYPLNAYSWEIPEGGCLIGQDPLEAAKRELKEETGLVAQNWTKLLDCHLSNSVTNEYGMAYLAKDLTQHAPEPEETEDLKIRRLPLKEAIDMALTGQITDALSMVALQRVALMNP